MTLDDLAEVELPPPSDPHAEAFAEATFVVDVPARLGLALARLEQATIMLLILQRMAPSAGPYCSPARVDPSSEVNNISGYEEWIDWDLLEKEIDEEEELEMKRKRGLQGAPRSVISSSGAFASAFLPDPYAGHCPIPGAVSCCSREEYKRFLDSFRGR